MRITYLVIFLLTAFAAQAQFKVGKQANKLNISYSNPQEYQIADIQVTGIQFLDPNALISITGLKVGDKIKVPGSEISSAIQKLWKQGIIGDISIYANKIEDDRIYLTIELKERPRLTRFSFEGISKSKAGELKDEIELARGRILTDVVLKSTELKVKNFFKENGYLNTKVKIIQQKDTVLKNSVRLRILVDRGKKIKVHAINFQGNDAFPSSKLRSKLKGTGEKPRFSIHTDLISKFISLFDKKGINHFVTNVDTISKNDFKEYLAENVKLNFFKSAKYDESKFKEDKKSLIAFYNAKGYRDAEVIDDTIYYHDNRSVNIDIKVNPGQRYYFRDIIWTGNYVYEEETLDKVLGINKGDVYDMELINKKLNFNPNGPDISSLYMDNGYLFFNVTPIEVNIDEDSIDVEMRIYEGAQATIEKVYVTGNDRTSDHVILRELRTLPGRKFSRAEIIRTQRELSQLGYFNPETIAPTPMPDPINETVDIEWKVEEQPSDQIELSGGFGGGLGFVGTVGLTFNNFSLRKLPYPGKWRGLPVGDGQRLSLRVQANGRRFQSYSIGFNEPWLGGRKPNNLGLNYSYSVQRSINRFTNEVLGSLTVQNISLSLGRRVRWPDDFFTISNSISYQIYDLFNFNQQLGFNTGVANSVTFNNTIARNSIDNPKYPRRGSSVSLSASFTPPYSFWRDIDFQEADNATRYKWIEFHKWMFDSKFYLNIVGDLVLQTRAHFGFIGSYNSDLGAGPFERFQLGGDGLSGQNFLLGTDVIGLRGYPNNSIVPFDTENSIEGGTVFNKYVFELRYPISLNPTATIYMTTFMEAGNNWNDFSEFTPFDNFRSAGFGARIFMPAFGLLGIDWAYGFDKLPGTNEVSGAQFHFSIGQQIR